MCSPNSSIGSSKVQGARERREHTNCGTKAIWLGTYYSFSRYFRGHSLMYQHNSRPTFTSTRGASTTAPTVHVLLVRAGLGTPGSRRYFRVVWDYRDGTFAALVRNAPHWMVSPLSLAPKPSSPPPSLCLKAYSPNNPPRVSSMLLAFNSPAWNSLYFRFLHAPISLLRT